MAKSYPSREELLKAHHSSQSNGLSVSEARRRLMMGKNTLEQVKKKSLLLLFFSQFSDFMVLILMGAAVISFLLALFGSGDYVDPVMILIIVIFNALIGTIQERRAEAALEALKRLRAPRSTVIRGGRSLSVYTEDLVPGDVVRLSTGDIVPADGILLDGTGLQTDESLLTGESRPVEKKPVPGEEYLLFSATAILAGHGTMLVTATGMHTEVGKIAGMLKENTAPETPLQQKLARVSLFLGIGAIFVCIAVFLLGLYRSLPPGEIFITSVSLAVAAIPEGLPAIVTVMLALGVRRMAAKHSIVRRLPAVETLGSVDVICTDKTGTLTQNNMRVVKLFGDELPLLSAALLASNQTDQTERAIFARAADYKLSLPALQEIYPRISEIPFSSDRKRMTVVVRHSGGYRVIMKGGAEVVLSHTPSPAMQSEAASLAKQGLRVLAVAAYDTTVLSQDPESGPFRPLGLIGIQDPLRPEARDAVLTCRAAGIHTVMITGDHRDTASAIARDAGILQPGDIIMTGKELDQLSEEALLASLPKITVFARVTPSHKLRIVKAFRSLGKVVCMTGDGVNDAPALKAADIGLAMGAGGTEVAREASDMVLTDSNFSTIVDAVREGRGIFQNIRRALHFLLSSNIGEILTIFGALLLSAPPPLSPIQLLWINLVTDSLPALALGFEPPDRHIMEEGPVKKNALFGGGLPFQIVTEGIMIGLLSLSAYFLGCLHFGGKAAGMTLCFGTLSLSQLIHAFNMRSDRSLFSLSPLSNRKLLFAFVLSVLLQLGVMLIPGLQNLFAVVPLPVSGWGILLLFALFPLVFGERYKLIMRPGRP